MPTLHLGVIDIPYAGKSGITTGDVADILEARYHILELYYEIAGAEIIAQVLETSAAEAMESMAMGSNVGISLTADAEERLGAAFRVFLAQDELSGLVPGVPTAASNKGVSHRLKHPYAKDNPERPSFIDTGLYSASMRAWID